jgi:cytochrome c-type biogenesis protein
MIAESILTPLSLGLLTVVNPCVLPLYPGFLAYLSGTREQWEQGAARYLLGVAVLAGVLTMMLGLGALLAGISLSVGRALSVLLPVADLVILGLGVLLIADRNPFKGLPQIKLPVLSHPLGNAFLYGLLYGPLAFPCAGPFVVGIFAFSVTFTEGVGRLLSFLWFGLGFGVPLVIISLLSGGLQRRITGYLARRARTVNLMGGVLMVGVGLFDLIQNWSLLWM